MSTAEGAPPPRRRRGAIITLLVGVALVLAMPFIGVAGALFSGIGGAVVSSQGPVFVSPNPNVVDMREGREARLLVPVSEAAPDVSACEITAPSGANVEPHALPQVPATEERYGTDTYYAFGRFQATESGDHVVDCSASGVVVAVSLERPGLWTVPLLWLGGGAVGILIGALLLVIGITRLVRVGEHNKAAKRAASPGLHNPTAGDAASAGRAPNGQGDDRPPSDERAPRSTSTAVADPAPADPVVQNPAPATAASAAKEVQNPLGPDAAGALAAEHPVVQNPAASKSSDGEAEVTNPESAESPDGTKS